MPKKPRTGVQIRFNPESEKDLIDFFSRLKKAEVHMAAVCAFRMYIRAVGFYDRRLLDRLSFPENTVNAKPETEPIESEAVKKTKGVFDEEAFTLLDGLFDSENAVLK